MSLGLFNKPRTTGASLSAQLGFGTTNANRSPLTLPAPAPSTSRQVGGLPDRFDLNNAVDQFSGQAVGAVGLAAQFPSRVSETPFSIADVGLKRAGVDVGQSPIGSVFGALGEGVKRIGNFIPALINSEDAQLYKAVGDLSDDTELTPEVLAKHGIAPHAFGMAQNAGGLPILGALGITGHTKTVGELKSELAKRGFFRDEDGAPVDPQQRLAQLRGGKSTLDFGYASINDNPLVDMATRLAVDPTNALFFLPGGALVKGAEALGKGTRLLKGGVELASAGDKVLPVARLIESGEVAAKMPRPLASAEALLRGDTKMGTFKGLSLLLRDSGTAAGRLALATAKRAVNPASYVRAAEGSTGIGRLVSRATSFQKSSLALGATNMAVGRLAAVVNAGLGGDVPVLSDIAAFSSDVENDRPLSNNAAWMLASSMSFPFGEVLGEPLRAAGREKVRILGRNELDAFDRAAGGRSNLLARFGGEDGLQQFAYYLDKQIVRERLGDDAILAAVGARGLEDGAARTQIVERGLQHIVDRYREQGKINGKDRFEAFQRWGRDQGGFADKSIDFTPSFDDLVSRWQQFVPVQQFVGPLLREKGVTVGLRSPKARAVGGQVLFRQVVDQAGARLKALADENGTIAQSDLKRLLSDHPELNAFDSYGYWAKYTLPDAPPLTLRSVQQKLTNQRKQSVDMAEFYADVNRHEASAPPELPANGVFESRSDKIDRLRGELADTLNDNGAIRPDAVDRSQAIQRELEGALADENNVAWTVRAEQERRVNVDPATSRQLQDDAGKALGAPDEMPASMDASSPQMIEWMHAVDQQIAAIDPSYQAVHAPTRQVIAAMRPDDVDFIRALDTRTALGAWLNVDGPFAKLSAFYDHLFGAVKQSELHRATKQAIYNEFIPLGANAKQVDAWLSKLEQLVRDQTHTILGQRIQVFRGLHALPAGKIAEKAREKLPQSVVARLGDKGIINRFDRAGSAFWRNAHKGTSRLSQGLDAFYRLQQNLPGSGARRLVGRTVYPIFRFLIDPRWILMNSVEAQVMGVVKDGTLTASGPLSRGAGHFLNDGRPISDMAVIPDSGLLFGKRYAAYMAKAFDKRSIKSTEAALNAIGEQAPELAMLRQAMVREANLDFAGGAIDAATHARRVKAGTRAIAEHINDFLYRVDKRGAKGAVNKELSEAVAEWLTPEEAQVLSPLLQQVAIRNTELWRDVEHMYTGSPDRSRVERVLNSYWLYWPISYQVKATKWLADTMLNGSFGHDNGALLAGKYALWQQQHQERLKRDPGYAAMFEQNPTLWFAAQMLMPITPEDIGVSLARPTRLAGDLAEQQVNTWTGSRMDLFTTYKQAQEGPLSALTWIVSFGPFYTAELLKRAERDKAIQSLLHGNQTSGQPLSIPFPVVPSTAPGVSSANP